MRAAFYSFRVIDNPKRTGGSMNGAKEIVVERVFLLMFFSEHNAIDNRGSRKALLHS